MSRTPLRCVVAMLVTMVAISAIPSAYSGSLTAELVASEVLEADGLADVTFTIEVSNGGDTTAGDVRIVFADGAEVGVGDVAAEGKASSESQRKVIARTSPTHNLPIEATLKYTSGGESVEKSIILTVRVPQ